LIPHTFVSHAVDLRDSFLIALLLAVPLRERTCIQLTYKSDGTGHLRYSKKDQAWRIELPANQVKNQRIISRTLPVFLNASIERYLGEARPRLLNTWGSDAENIDFLFISSYRKCDSTKVIDELTGDLYELTQGQMSVSSRLGYITKKHLGLSVRAHAFRHITASRFLKLNPGQYQACADLLADSVETVMKHYAYHDASWNEKMLNDSISKAFACENN
jgi:integrase